MTEAPGWALADGPAPLYGFWGLNGHTSPSGFADMKARFGLTVFQVANDDPRGAVSHLLPMVRDAGLRVTLRLAGDHDRFTSASGDFDLAMWKASLASWSSAALAPFVEEGTLVGHMLIDDVYTFAGAGPTAAELDEMARYSKERFPGLMAYVRLKATDLPIPAAGRYAYLDAAVNQYEAADGPVAVYASTQAARAIALGVGVINGMNIADGGDGSAGRGGYREGHFPMTAAEVRAYGVVLADTPACGMFLNWEYDGEELWADGTVGDAYFDDPAMVDALAEVGRHVSHHAPVRLLRPDGE